MKYSKWKNFSCLETHYKELTAWGTPSWSGAEIVILEMLWVWPERSDEPWRRVALLVSVASNIVTPDWSLLLVLGSWGVCNEQNQERKKLICNSKIFYFILFIWGVKKGWNRKSVFTNEFWVKKYFVLRRHTWKVRNFPIYPFRGVKRGEIENPCSLMNSGWKNSSFGGFTLEKSEISQFTPFEG